MANQDETFGEVLIETAAQADTPLRIRLASGATAPAIELLAHDDTVLWSVNPDGTLATETPVYAAAPSAQALSGDLNVAAGAGKGAGSSAFLAGVMGNLLGDTLTKVANYLAGVIGALSITGTRATKLPVGAVMGVVMDGVTTGDAAVVAEIDGSDPSSVTRINAAFAARMVNNNAGSGFDYGLDLYDPGVDNTILSGGGKPVACAKADLRLTHEVCFLTGAGAPTNAVTGAGFAQIGSLYTDYTNGVLYINTNTKASPTWTKVGTQS